jgi:hypothetical protein
MLPWRELRLNERYHRMLPPILEIYVIWHPADAAGDEVAREIFNHFMLGPTFSGIIGGGIHVALRRDGWTAAESAPRPVYTEGAPGPNEMQPARFVAFVPLLGLGMAEAVQPGSGSWHGYVRGFVEQKRSTPDTIGVFPFVLDHAATDGTELGELLGAYQRLAASTVDEAGETRTSMMCRDLTQGLAQLLAVDENLRLTAFISHTKRHSAGEGADVEELIEMVREIIHNTRLAEFFDASDLQPGSDWDQELRNKAASGALLALRTDLYASREWCQREVVIAKTSGMPVIMLDAIGLGEERGSFLMDHVPRVPLRKEGGQWRRKDVYRGLNLLVDDCLKSALWLRQKELSQERPELDVAWWAPHAPEPLTLLTWIEQRLQGADDATNGETLRVLHPDPPLGPEEREVLRRYAAMTRLGHEIDVMTPRQLATRGG